MAKTENTKRKGGTIMDSNNNNTVSKFAPYFEINETPFVIKIGKTTYEVSTHFSTKGKETVLGQFKELLTELNIA